MIVNLDDYIKNTNGITVSVLQCSAKKLYVMLECMHACIRGEE
jgi:hypothetical protein